MRKADMGSTGRYKRSNTNDLPLVTIIVPFYNSEPYLPRCLRSLEVQSYPNIELIMIDDGSNDNSACIAHAYAEHFHDAKVISQINSGQAAARNAAIEMARGEYLCFVDSDDYVHCDFIAHLVEACAAGKREMAICNFMKVVGAKSAPEFDVGSSVDLNTAEALAELNLHRRFDSSAGGKLFPKCCFEETRFPVGVKCEDAAIMHLLISRCNAIHYVSEPLYYYVRELGSTTRTEKPDWQLVRDALNAVYSRMAYYQKAYPELVPTSRIELLIKIIYVFGRFTSSGGVFSKHQKEKLLSEARSCLGCMLANRSISLARKAQAVVFCASPHIYSKLYSRFSDRRGY